MFYRISVLRVFERILYDPRTLKEERFKDLVAMCAWIVRRFYDDASKSPNIFMAAIFANTSKQWQYYLHGQYEEVEDDWMEDSDNQDDIFIDKEIIEESVTTSSTRQSSRTKEQESMTDYIRRLEDSEEEEDDLLW